MKNLWICFLFVFFALSVTGQNPFDIVSGPMPQDSIENIVQNTFQSPFDISSPKSPMIEANNVKGSFYNWLVTPGFNIPKLGLIVMLLATILLAFVLNVKKDILYNVIQSCMNTNIMRLQIRNQSHERTSPLNLLSIVYVLSLSVFFYGWIQYLFDLSGIKIYLFLLLITILLRIGKSVIINGVGEIFENHKVASEYNFSFVNFTVLAGVILIPINILISVTQGEMMYYLLLAGSIILIFLILGSYAQGLMSVLGAYANRVFHFFLYLCTFEIIPIGVALKFFYELLG